ncbi:OmpA family protein [Aquimarina sp. 2201CG14-23]|uniref:OmpA family protein n=1 Tax=Aquimarina mycalae TaxID=3040073 RepID=UPI0024782613|nr:OmpA family protein [Aquimarina sp. 2201CG14-23]MDH7445898.1 OmpA family protein [Aquimarina sp. 2201CG14-23]
MKKHILFVLLAIAGITVQAQDLPANPEPGKCYVRCTTPDIYENQTVQVQITPEYKKLKTYPATFEKVTEKVLVKEEGKKLTVVPAKYKTETVTFVKKQGASTLKVIPAKFGTGAETVEIKPAYAQWELGSPAPDCASSNPDDCRYWCYKGYPAEFTTIPTQTLSSDATTASTPIAEQPSTYTKRVIAEPARVIEEIIPAEYATITKTVMVKDAYTDEVVVPATFKTVSKEVLTQKGGLTTWKEVECSLVEYSALPINWNLGSATLTSQAKSIIDTRLMPVLANNPGTKMEIASHTDARGSKSSNKDLSERRAQAVVTYLLSKGVNGSRLVANGYGENRLKNRCADGVSCTERQHAANRRTEFRLINN